MKISDGERMLAELRQKLGDVDLVVQTYGALRDISTVETIYEIGVESTDDGDVAVHRKTEGAKKALLLTCVSGTVMEAILRMEFGMEDGADAESEAV